MLAITTAAAVVAVGVEQGILLAIGFSLVRHVRHSYRAHSMVLVPDASGRWEPTPAGPGLQTDPGLSSTVTAPISFTPTPTNSPIRSASLSKRRLHPVRWFVFDAEAIGDLDLSAAQTFRIARRPYRKGVRVVFGRVNHYLLSDMRRHRIAAVIGEGRISRRFTRRSPPSARRGSRLVRIQRRVPVVRWPKAMVVAIRGVRFARTCPGGALLASWRGRQ